MSEKWIFNPPETGGIMEEIIRAKTGETKKKEKTEWNLYETTQLSHKCQTPNINFGK